ncbi:tryptophan synthase subunit alpha [Candidatus Bathyarchaeota archaeon]|nr:tryptophan synthase subunit alpha [Candidatus Bathyarchaeota archaeon]
MKLENKFQELQSKKEGAHMPHVYFGDPNEAFSLDLLETLSKNGADILEFGIPFSDPTADGPTFQAVCERALVNGITPDRCIEGIKKIRERGIKNPIVVTTYYNIPYVMGIGKFLKKIKEVGAQAIIVPNVPIEEAEVLLVEGKKRGIHPIFQIAPTTTKERLKKITDIASGFLYVIGVEGVTGVRKNMGNSTIQLVKRAKKYTDIPLLAGFGISTRQQASAIVAAGADGVIAGSAYAKVYEKNLEKPENTLNNISNLIQQIKQGCIEGYRQR